MKTVQFAVAGCGSIGARHISLLAEEPRAAVVAICDIDKKRCEELAEQFRGVPYFTDYKQMLKNPAINVVNICTPHFLHEEMAIAAAKAGKNILVEKPMALSSKSCLRMITAAQEAGVHLFIVKQNRFNIPVLHTKEALLSKKLGRIFMVKCDVLWNRYDGYYAESDWRGKKEKEGGALFTQASHFIDLMVWLFGDIVEAHTEIATKNHEIEIEDCGNAIFRFESGIMGAMTWTTCIYNKNYEGSLTIIGEYGTIKIGGHYLNKIDYWDVRAHLLPENIEFSDRPNFYGKYQGSGANHDHVFKNVIAKLLDEENNIVDGYEGLRTVQAIETIYKGVKK